MLREGVLHADWCEMTMSMMREKQCEACERRLFAYPQVALFAPEATDADAQQLLEGSFENAADKAGLVTLMQLRTRVIERLPLEAVYVSAAEMQLLEKLLMNDGQLLLGEWDDLGAAEALVRRLWCSFSAQGDDWYLLLPQALHEPLTITLGSPHVPAARERLLRFDATIHGLLYIAGFLHAFQPVDVFVKEVVRREDALGLDIARRYMQATFEYIVDANGDLILLHPGLADPYQLVKAEPVNSVFTLEITPDMIAGAINGLLPEEIPLHNAMCGALHGALRPELDVAESAEDLRMLAKQGVSLVQMQEVMSSMLAVLPTAVMNDALRQLSQSTPHWLGLKTSLVQ